MISYYQYSQQVVKYDWNVNSAMQKKSTFLPPICPFLPSFRPCHGSPLSLIYPWWNPFLQMRGQRIYIDQTAKNVPICLQFQTRREWIIIFPKVKVWELPPAVPPLTTMQTLTEEDALLKLIKMSSSISMLIYSL